MSEAVIFEFPYNLFLKERLEFVVICQDELEAKIMRVIEYEMIKLKEAWQAKCELATEAKKPLPREPRDYWVRLSHSMIIARLYRFDSAWFKREKGKKEQGEEKQKEDKHPLLLSKSTLRNAINSLITKGFLVMRSKPGDEYGAPIYTLHRVNVQKAMKALPANPYTIFHRGGVSNFGSGGEFQTLEVPVTEVETPSSKDANSQFQDLNITKDITTDSSQDTFEEGETGASAPMPPDVIDFEARKGDTASRLKAIASQKAIATQNDTPSHIAIDDTNEEDIDVEATVKRPAIRIATATQELHMIGGEIDATSDTQRDHDGDRVSVSRGVSADLHPRLDSGTPTVPQAQPQAQTSVIAPMQPVRGVIPGGAAVPPTLGGPRFTGNKTRAPGAKRGKNGTVTQVLPPIPLDALRIMDDWDSLFKAPVARTDKHIEAAVKLIPCHPSKADLKNCKGWLFTTDNPQRPWFRKKGVKLTDVAENYGAWQSVLPVPDEEESPEDLDPYSFASILKRQEQHAASA